MTRKIQKAGSCFIHSKDKNACLSVKRKNSKRKKTKNRNSNNEMNLCEFYQSAVKIPYLGALRTNVSKTDGECHLSYDFILSIANNYNYTFNTSYTLGGKTFGSKVFKLVGESKEKNPYVPTRLILGSLLDKKDNKFFRNFPLNSQQDKEQKIKLGVKQLQEDPFNFFKDKNVKDIVTVKVHSTSSKGIIVKPEGSSIEVLIKKNQIAINAEDARSNRFIPGDRIDAAISELDIEKRKISLSIKLLEEMQNKEAVSKFSSPLSGKNLPFSSLSEKLGNKKKEDK